MILSKIVVFFRWKYSRIYLLVVPSTTSWTIKINSLGASLTNTDSWDPLQIFRVVISGGRERSLYILTRPQVGLVHNHIWKAFVYVESVKFNAASYIERPLVILPLLLASGNKDNKRM